MSSPSKGSWRWQVFLLFQPVLGLAVLSWVISVFIIDAQVMNNARARAKNLCQDRAVQLRNALHRLVAEHPVPRRFDDPPKPLSSAEIASRNYQKYVYGAKTPVSGPEFTARLLANLLPKLEPHRREPFPDLLSNIPFTDSGLPALVLAVFEDWKRKSSNGQRLPLKEDRQAAWLIREALYHEASVVTPSLLEQVDPANELHWHESWENTLSAQRFLATTTELIPGNGLHLKLGPYRLPKHPKHSVEGMWLIGTPTDVGGASGNLGMVSPEALTEFCSAMSQQRGWRSGSPRHEPIFNATEWRWLERTEEPWCALQIALSEQAKPQAEGDALLGFEVLANSGTLPVVTAVLCSDEGLYDRDQGGTFGLYHSMQWAKRGLIALVMLSFISALLGLRSLRRTMLQQQALNDMKTNFIASVTHELRAPVASMQLLAEGLHAGTVTTEAKRQDYFRFLVEECRRLGALIANVLDVSRIERGTRSFRFEEIDLQSLVSDTVKLHEPRAASLGVTLRCEADDVNATADALAIQQVLTNLLDNALKFAPRDSEVSVLLTASDSNHWRLSVRDHGPGIPAAECERVFEAFHRLGSELRRETQGIGIGLSIVKHIAEAHHGRVWVESTPDVETTFHFECPTENENEKR